MNRPKTREELAVLLAEDEAMIDEMLILVNREHRKKPAQIAEIVRASRQKAIDELQGPNFFDVRPTLGVVAGPNGSGTTSLLR